jgi:hypothetical protein
MAHFVTCHNPAGEFAPTAGRCDQPLAAHEHPLYVGPLHLGQSVGDAGAVCDGLVCGTCGECQGGLRRPG